MKIIHIALMVILTVGSMPAQEDCFELPDSLALLLQENDKADMNRVEALDIVTNALFDQRQFTKAQPYINELTELSSILNDNYLNALCDYYRGRLLFCTSKYKESLAYLLKAEKTYDLLRKNEKTLRLGMRIYNLLAGCYVQSRMFPEYYQYIRNAMEINKGLKDKRADNILKLNYIYSIGVLEDFSEAISLYKDLLTESTFISNKAKYTIFNNIAECYYQLHTYDSAFMYYDSTALTTSSVQDVIRVLNGKAKVCNATGKYREAIHHAEKCLDTLRLDGSEEPKSHTLNILAYAYHKLSENDTALVIVDKGIAIARENSFLWDEKEGMSVKNDILYDLGRYREAVENLKLTNMLDDSLKETAKMNLFEQLHLQYRFKEAEAQLEHEREMDKMTQVKKRLTLYLAIVILAILIVIVLLLLKRKNILLRDRKIKSDMLADELDKKRRELTSNLLVQTEKNNALKGIIEDLSKVNGKDELSRKVLLSSVKRLRQHLDNNTFKEFDCHFVEVHPKFYDNLLSDFPELTRNELRLCAYIKMKLSSKEIATINNITVNGVIMARKRLRKKLKINDTDKTFTAFLARY
ncbi:MAG: hypothetical protein ACTTKO_00325 [Candidatus Limimorpha sp.]